MNRFFITTPIYYVNAKPHLGHAYSTIVADCINRFYKLLGYDTFMLTGTDEHGDKIVQAAEKAGQAPVDYVEKISSQFRSLWPDLGILNDDFIRTTEDRHRRVVQEILQKTYEAGDIYQSEYEGLYCFGCEQFLTEKDLVDGKCPDHKTKPELIREKNYFFRMSGYQSWLKEHIKKNPDFIRPKSYAREVLAMLEMGVLEDLCISRPKSRLSWGIELPFDKNYVTYVWFDALLNYITALDGPKGENFKKFWPVANHVVAKDILKPHAVFWPTILKAAGFEPYQHLNVHGYWLVKDMKMSKSLGNAVAPLTLKDKYGLDAFRYFLMREMRFGRDASFSEEALIKRLNADLANDLGNLFSRVLGMAGKYLQSMVPDPGPDFYPDEDLKELAANAFENFCQLFERLRFSEALEALFELVRALNKFVDSAAPWTLYKENKTAELKAVMYTLLEYMHKVALCLWPVMPHAAEAMLGQLGQKPPHTTCHLVQQCETFGTLIPGTLLAGSSALFPRVDIEKKPLPVKKEKQALNEKISPEASEPACIEFTDFQKLDLRIGTVFNVENHPDADRLYIIRIDLGEDKPRQIVAGLKDAFDRDFLLHKQVVVVANLAPRKLRGVESQGMILAVKDTHGMQLLTPTGKITSGSKVS